MPKIFGHSENIFMPKNKLGKTIPNNFGQILKVIFFFPSLWTIPGAQSHENQYVGQNNIRTNVLHP
jgi:hypothetical protein